MVSFSAHWPDSTLMQGWLAGLPDSARPVLEQACQWVRDHYREDETPGGESLLEHSAELVLILASLRSDLETRAAALLLCLPEYRGRGPDPLHKAFGTDVGKLLQGTHALLRLGKVAREINQSGPRDQVDQREMLRKMLLAMAADLRIVLIRLASRLQTLRWHARTKTPCDRDLAAETLDLYAPLANRLGVWQIKWEMEDLAFRFLEPDRYREIAGKLEEKRVEREEFIRASVDKLRNLLNQAGIEATISGRPKHIYSIWNKMRNKAIDFSKLYDLRALRVIVSDERACYAVLGLVHEHWTPIVEEFDDYIARPKPNGYRSLHTVIQDVQGRAFEVQIRTRAMHEFAEHGMAAHWRYKEAGPKGGQVAAADPYSRQLAWMRQLLEWQTEADSVRTSPDKDSGTLSDRIYVLSPQARVIELPRGATPVDFAYHLHTDLGHRCRGAKVDGVMVPLQTRLETGQTVEVLTTKAGGPSRDWLNPQLGYLASNRARSKVRAWFNAIELQQRIVQGHSLVDKELQRLGKTAVNQEQLAQQLGFARADDLYVAVAKDDFSLRHLDAVFNPAQPARTDHQQIMLAQALKYQEKAESAGSGGTGILVEGVSSLLTQLARCCRPAPPDEIGGFVTRGRGVSVHRTVCPSFRQLSERHPERVIDVSWGQAKEALYPVDVVVHAHDRSALLRDLSEAFSRLRLNVIGVNTHSKGSLAHMQFTVQVADAEDLAGAMRALSEVQGVLDVQRR